MNPYISNLSKLRPYYWLTKPGIVYGNVMSAVAGLLLASTAGINYWLLAELAVGVALVIASACVFNNYLDRQLDAKMARTNKRALVTGTIPLKQAIVYASSLGVIGFLILGVYTNWLTVIIGLIGYVDYIVLYGIAKRRTLYGTAVGSLSGSASLVAGYVAVANRLDATALTLFLIMTFWQMAHFYAIAMYRLADYAAADLPLLPIKKGLPKTKFRIQLYIVGFIVATAQLSFLGDCGIVYFLTMLGMGGAWFRLGLKANSSHIDWARSMFKFSLLVLLVFCILLAFNAILP